MSVFRTLLIRPLAVPCAVLASTSAAAKRRICRAILYLTGVLVAFPMVTLASPTERPKRTAIAIEAAMRVWQERCLVATGRLVQWTDHRGMPLPAFPKDGTFPCADRTDEQMTALVQQLAREMSYTRVLPGRAFIDAGGKRREFEYPDLACFALVTPVQPFEGLRAPPETPADRIFKSAASNFRAYVGVDANSPLAGITQENYGEKFAEICDVLRQLETPFFLNENYRKIDGRAGYGADQSPAIAAEEALQAYRTAPQAVSNVGPILVMRAELASDLSTTVSIYSSTGYWEVDTRNPGASGNIARYPAGSDIEYFVLLAQAGFARGPETNYPANAPEAMVRLGAIGPGEVATTPMLGPPPPDQLSVESLGTPGNHEFRWDANCFVRVRCSWTFSADSLLASCDCPCDCEPGSSEAGLGSVRFKIHLGSNANGSLGSLLLHADTPTRQLSSPRGLIRQIQAGVTSVVDYSDSAQPEGTDAPLSLAAYPIRQLHAADWIASVSDVGPFRYSLDFHHRTGLPEADSVSRLVDVSGSIPFRSYTFEHVEGNVNDFQITASQSGAATQVYRYRYDPEENSWTLTTGAGADVRHETLSRREGGTDWWERRTVRGADDVVVSDRESRFRTFPWNNLQSPFPGEHGELVEAIVDPTGEAQVTRYSYFENEGLDRRAYGRLRMVEFSDGSWVRYEYDKLTGVLHRTIRPFGDAAPDSPESSCRVTVETEASIEDVDGDGKPELVRTRVEEALGLEVSRSYVVWLSRRVPAGDVEAARTLEVRCLEPGAPWNASANLVTEVRTFATGADVGRTCSVLNPDGTMSAYAYATTEGRLTTTMSVGEPDAARERIVRGQRTITVTHPKGATQSVSMYDIESGLLLEHSETFDQDFDVQGRPLTTIHLDGTAEQFVYACCGLEAHEDRAGTVETYGHDSLLRRTSTTRAGITTVSVYDAAGRVIETRQRSRDGQERVISHAQYSAGGRLVASRDLLDRRTSYAQGFDQDGHFTRTTTRPDLATQVETLHRDGRVMAVGGSAVHPVAYEYQIVSDTHGGRTFNAEVTTTIRLGREGERTEWTRTYTDMLSRTYKVEVPAFTGSGTDVSLTYFDASGRMVRRVSPEGVVTLLAYDGLGRLQDTAIDVNGNGIIDYAGSDRITRTTEAVVQSAERGVLRRSGTSVWLTIDEDVPTIVAESETNAAARTSWSRTWGRETETRVELPGDGEVRQITRRPDGVVITAVSLDGFASEQSVVNALGETFERQTFRYDAWGRQEAVIDARNGETTVVYDVGDRPQDIVSPAPDADQPRQTTTLHYDVMDRVATTVLPDGAMQFRSYFPSGEVQREWGARTYPVEYSYDSQGRMETMTTWQDYAGATGAATTRWGYHPARGVVTRKTYEGGSHVDYTYTPGGMIEARRWARGLVTTYRYDPRTGDRVIVDYADSTPDLSFTFDRAGRVVGTTDAVGSVTYAFSEDTIDSEKHTSGLLAGLTLGRGHDLGRLASLSVGSASGIVYDVNYGYRDRDGRDTGRLVQVTSGGASVAYGYEPDSQLLRDTLWFEGSTERLRATTLFDRMSRLFSRTTRQGSGQVTRSFVYGYNPANQRERIALESGESWRFGYDPLGQVTSGEKQTETGDDIPGYEFGYGFDDIGNRKLTTTNGRAAVYSPNLLNQYEQRDVPRAIDILGEALDESIVRVNGLATVRTDKPGLDDYFFTPYPARDPGAHDLTIRSTIEGEPELVFDEQRRPILAGTPEVFSYDTDGNLTDDWRWHYTWDAENRLIAMDTQPGAVAAGAPHQRLEFDYDHQGRRSAKRLLVRNSAGGAWTLQQNRRFLYDGWNLIAEFEPDIPNSTLAVLHTYTWGLDLSGTLQGAGGVGGLLLTSTASGAAIPTFDGNGNVVAYTALGSGEPLAEFEYGPFGETIRSTGSLSESSSFRFSTKFADAETGMVYYGLRYYNSSTGRWLSRDPIEEQGGVNLYEFVNNAPTNFIDRFGENPETVAGFISHYYFGGGASVDISNAGFFTRFQSSIAKDTNALKGQLTALKPGFACNGTNTVKFNTKGLFKGKFAVANIAKHWSDPLTDVLQVLNQGGLNMGYECEGEGKCACNSSGVLAPVSADLKCKLTFFVKDRFANPTDKVGPYYERNEQAYQACISGCKNLPRAQRSACMAQCEKQYPRSELPGGTAYDIFGSWSENTTFTVTY